MFCPKCGNEVADGAQFCSKCGNNLNGAIVANSETKKNPFVESVADGSNFLNGLSESLCRNICLGSMALAVLIVGFNVGGRFTGTGLIKALDMMPSNLPGDIAFSIFLLTVSHIGVVLFGIIGFCLFLQERAKISSIMLTISGLLGVLSGMIAGWNVIAEVIGSILGIVTIIVGRRLEINLTDDDDSSSSDVKNPLA